MDVEILIHGVPHGYDYYGIAEERKLAELFYVEDSEEIKFVVETQKKQNTVFTYYSYLLYKGVVGEEGRPGSYFGITIRIDKYYTDVKNMFAIMDMAFKKYVLGIILTSKGSTYKYLIPSFANKENEMQKLQQGIIQLIQNSCVADKFINLDVSAIPSNSSAAKCNLGEATEDVLQSALKKYSKVVLSPNYESNAVIAFKQKLQDYENKISQMEQKHNQEIAGKDQTISELRQSVQKLQAKITSLEEQLAQNGTKASIEKLLNEIKKPITQLASYFKMPPSDEPKKVDKKPLYSLWVGLANVLVSILIVLLICFVLPQNSDSNTGDVAVKKSLVELQKKYDNLEAENKRVLLLCQTKDTEIERLKKLLDDKQSNVTSQVNFSIKVSPDVKEVEVGKEYTFSIAGYNGNGTWRVDGFESPQDKKAKSITVRAIANTTGKAVVSYLPDGCANEKKKKREFKYKTPNADAAHTNSTSDSVRVVDENPKTDGVE